MLNSARVLIQDEVTKPVKNAPIRWGMLTDAGITLDGSTAYLNKNNQGCTFEILEPTGASFQIVSTKPFTTNEYENTGTQMLSFTIHPTNDFVRLAVLCTPNSKTGMFPKPTIMAITNWPGTR